MVETQGRWRKVIVAANNHWLTLYFSLEIGAVTIGLQQIKVVCQMHRLEPQREHVIRWVQVMFGQGGAGANATDSKWSQLS